MMKKNNDNLEIECPECGEFIDINEQISQRLKEDFADERKQLEIELRKELHSSHTGELEKLQQVVNEKDKILLDKKDEDEFKDVKIKEMKHQLETQDKRIEVERQKAALEAKKEAMQEYEKMAEDFATQKNCIKGVAFLKGFQ